MGTEADYLIDQHFDREHGEYGDPLPPVRVEADVGLLPCPFCGGRAEMNYGGFGECFVTCADDNCGGRLGTGIWFTAAAQAMDVWNRRPNDRHQPLVGWMDLL